MPIILSSEAQMVRDTAMAFFAERSPVASLRKLRDTADPVAMVPARTVTKRVEVRTPICPTDDQLRDVAIAASRATYQHAPGGARSCACPTDTYVNRGATLPCNGPGAIKPSSWAMCSREQVPPTLVDEMRAKIAACAKV